MTTEPVVKKIPDVAYLINPNAGTILVTVKGYAPRTLDTSKIHADVMRMAAFKGLAQQRIVDKAAVLRARKDGALKTAEEMLAEKYTAVNAIMDHLESGSADWSVRGAPRGKADTDHTLTIRAMVEHSGKPYEAVNAMIDRRSTALAVSRTAFLDSMMTQPTIAELVRGYRAERVANVDVDGEMEELMGSGE